MTVNPLTKEQLIAYIRQLDEEYRRNRDAAMTLLRTIQTQDVAQGIAPPQVGPREDTTIGLIEKIMSSDSNRLWNAALVREKLNEVKPNNSVPDKTISNCLAKLLRREKIELVKRGTGSIPHDYKWKGGSLVGFPTGTLWK